ncbi:30S ribosomal protein S17 [Patescibacteria group bacterium]|nr:30S ribosomal protein S17 [Patescibacteria group bacterium]
MIGRVVSTKMQKTAAVLVERIAKHPLYQKTFIRSKKYLVDDSIGVKMGDMVEIIKVKPISKNKHWKIVKVIGKNLKEITEEKLKEEAKKIIAEMMPEGKKSEELSDGSSLAEEETKKDRKNLTKERRKI